MKTLDLSLNYDFYKDSPSDIKTLQEQTLAERFEWFMLRGINTAYPHGLGAKDGRIWYRIHHKVRLMNGEASVELEEAEVDFIKGIIANAQATWPPETYPLVIQYLERLENLK